MLKKYIMIMIMLLSIVFEINGLGMEGSASEKSSFHGTAHSNWYVVKFNASEPVVIDELFYKVSFTKCNDTRGTLFALFITNFSGVSSRIFGVRQGTLSPFRDGEIFFHVEFDGINFTINHLNLSHNFPPETGIWWDIPVPRGVWYLVCLAGKSSECEIEIWMNITGKVTFEGTTEGNNTFFLSSYEFMGRLNFIIPYILGMWNGRKTFTVNHTFVGSILAWNPDIGLLHLAITFPSGEMMHSFEIFPVTWEMGYRVDWVLGKVSPTFFFGDAGKWEIRMDALLIEFLYDKRFTPWLTFLGADIKLPE